MKHIFFVFSCLFLTTVNSFTNIIFQTGKKIPHLQNAHSSFLRVVFDGLIKYDRIDDAKEASRKFRRTVFTANDWKIHRSSNRHITQLLSLPNSFILRGISVQIAVVTFNAFCTVFYNLLVEKYKWNWLPVFR